MENETPEEMLKREISTLMQVYGITANRVYQLLEEMEEFRIKPDPNYQDAFWTYPLALMPQPRKPSSSSQYLITEPNQKDKYFKLEKNAIAYLNSRLGIMYFWEASGTGWKRR